MQEKHAVLFLVGFAVAGHAARLLLTSPATPPGQILAPSTNSADPAAHRDRAIRLARPLADSETIDLNLAPPEEIARLPRIGMSLAKRIVAFRTAQGPFRSLDDLERVAGVGPAMVGQLQGKVRFGGVLQGIQTTPPIGSSHGATVAYAPESKLVDLNSATLADLVTLPGIGPARARAILAYRRDKGPFAAVSELRAVPGLTRALVTRLTPLVRVR